jgi:hypothetical protein
MADNKFTSGGYTTKQTDIDPETGTISWDVTYKPDFALMYKAFKELNSEYKKFLTYKETAEDPNFKKIYNAFNTVWNAFRTHVRSAYPAEYKKLKAVDEQKLKEAVFNKLKEISATGGGAGAATFTPGEGANYATPFAFNPNKKAKGAKNIYYYKLGWKPVDAKKLHKQAKGIDHKDLWKNKLEEEATDAYVNNLNLTDPALTQFITNRVGDFDKIEDKLNTLLPLLKQAKTKTMDYYKSSPDFKVQYGTDLAVDYLDDIIKLFRDKK